MDKFIGRQEELTELMRINKLKKAALIVALGRRRIGKSRLIQEFGSKCPNYIEIQGIAPRSGQTNQIQLEHFSRELARQTKLPEVVYKDWEDAFLMLANYADKKKIVILLDEISWMGHYDQDFPGKLKNAWDLHFKKNPLLRLVLCGSVSSWIQKNILESTNFMGRISLELPLKELSLKESFTFFGKNRKRLSDLEALRILSLSGGVPRYLEEIDYSIPAEENYRNLCFKTSGFLFQEFDRIFKDIFERRFTAYHEIVQTLKEGPKTPSEISKESGHPLNGILTDYLRDLEISGFVRKDFTWDLKSSKISTIHKYRISDSYLRFYLKWIAPNKSKIEKGLFSKVAIERLPGFDSFIGLQFESILINNLHAILDKLKITAASVINVGPYFQTQNLRRLGCQIDILIQTKNTIYICECKAKQMVDSSVISEVEQKVKRLKYPKSVSIRTVLIYAGELDPSIEDQDYFDQIINFESLLS